MLFGALFVNMQYFSIKMMEGIVATSYSSGDKFYIDPRKLLPLARFLPQPKYGLFAFHCHKLTCLNIMQLVCSQKSSWWRWIWVNINSWPINFPYFYLCFLLSLHFFCLIFMSFLVFDESERFLADGYIELLHPTMFTKHATLLF